MLRKNHLAVSFIFCMGVGTTLVARAEKYVVDMASAKNSSLVQIQEDAGSQVLSLDITPEAAAKLESEGVIIEPRIEFQVMGTIDEGTAITGDENPQAKAQWAAGAMEIAKAHALADAKGKGQKICIIDTGIDASHKYFSGKILSATSRVPGSEVKDGHGHGTHVASLAAGSSDLGSPAPEAKLIIVKALNNSGSGDNDWIAKAIEDCIAKKATVINMSIGGSTESRVMKAAILRAKAAGITVVAAAGNDGGKINYPAAHAEVISVGAVNSSKAVASFSCRGSGLDFVAPGVNVTGARVGGGTVQMSGTSMASPFVAGLVALKNSRKAAGIIAKDLKLKASIQGKGLVNAHETALNR